MLREVHAANAAGLGVRAESPSAWISGDQVRMVRVKPDPADIEDPSKHQLFAGWNQAGEARWTGARPASRPLARWQDRTGVVTLTYSASLRKNLIGSTDGVLTTEARAEITRQSAPNGTRFAIVGKKSPAPDYLSSPGARYLDGKASA